MSGDPSASLVPGVPVAPAPVAPAVAPQTEPCRFGDGLAIGPDLEGAAEVEAVDEQPGEVGPTQ